MRGAATAEAQGTAPKVLRYAMRVAETGFDPAQISDLYSSTLCANIFDALYEYEFLARPVRLRSNTAAALPEASADFKTFTIRVKPGIYFADDPAFKGVKRELTAADYVYSIKRHFDPRWKSPTYTSLNNNRILGLDEVRQAALRDKKPFDYDTQVEGLRALDRYTIQFKLAEPNPRFTDELSDPARTGAVAREVVELYGDRVMSTRSGRDRTGSPSGGAAPGFRSRRTRTTATSSIRRTRRPTTPWRRPRSSDSLAASCR